MGDKKYINKPRRPKLHPAIWEEVCECKEHPDFVNRRMTFWGVHPSVKEELRFEFLVCTICGKTIILEEFIEFAGAKIDCSREDIVGYLHDLTRGARGAATQFKNADTIKEALSIHNLRYISKIEGGEVIRRANEKEAREIAEARENREREFARLRTANSKNENIRGNNINGVLHVNRAKQQKKREDKMKKSEFKCNRVCGRSFSTKSKLHNHKCNRDDDMNYIEKARARNR